MASAPGTTLKLFDPRPAVQWKNDAEEMRRVTGRQFRGTNPQGGTALTFWARRVTCPTRSSRFSRTAR